MNHGFSNIQATIGAMLIIITGVIVTFFFIGEVPFPESIDYENSEELTAVIKQFGVTAVMADIVEKSQGGSIFDCHQEAHHIGRAEYAVEKEKAFGSCDASCHSGCYHGAMETFLNEKGTANLAENIGEICESFATNFGIFECLHGVGHGILAFVNYDMPFAIDECNKLEDSFAQTSCYGGVFMENIITGQGLGAVKDHDTKWLNQTDPYFPCNGIDQDFALQYQCYQMQTSWMLTLSGYDFAHVATECLQVPRKDMTAICFKSLGRDAAGYTLRDPARILELCNYAPKENGYYEECLSGGLNVIIDFWGPALEHQATELCRLTKDMYKKTCYTILANRLPNLFSDIEKQTRICNGFELNYQHLCKINNSLTNN